MIKYAVLGSGSSANSYIIQYDPLLNSVTDDTDNDIYCGNGSNELFNTCSEISKESSGDEKDIRKEQKLTIVIDNGFSLKEFERRASETGFRPEDIDFIFLTHDHSDHLKGISILSSRYSIPVVMCSSTVLSGAVSSKIYKSLIVEAGQEYKYNSLKFNVFKTFHDAEGSVGYSFNIKGKIFTIITDTGIITEEMHKYASDSDFLFLEANYCPDMLQNGPYPWFLKKRIASDTGHLSNIDAVNFLEKLHESDCKSRKIYLCHLSDKNNCPDKLDSLIKERFSEQPGIDYRICRKGETVTGIPVKISLEAAI